MKKIVGASVMLAVFLTQLAGCALEQPAEDPAGPEETSVTESGPARPQDDYYRYINQDALDTMEFEYGYDSVSGSFDQDVIDGEIEGIINGVVAGSGYVRGSEEDIIKRAYEAYMAYDFENAGVPDELASMIEQIDGVTTVDEFMAVDAVLARDYNMPGFLNMSPEINPFANGEMIMGVSQTGSILNVPFTGIRDGRNTFDEVRNNGQMVIMTCGYDADTSEQYATELAYLAIDLYGATDMDIVEDMTEYRNLSVVSADEMREIFSNIDLDGYLSDIGFDVSAIDEYCITDREQLTALNSMLTDENIDALKVWELGNFYSLFARFIAPFYPELGGYVSRDYTSLEEQAVTEISSVFRSETDPLYVEQYYSEETDEALRSMCDDIREGYRALITDASWLSGETRAELLEKLDNIVYVTGADMERHDPSDFADITGNDYYEIYISYIRHMRRDLISSLTEDISATDIIMPMQVFNACYNPSINNITITVAITNAPYFDADADYYTNLGGLGMVIAHEMGHAFDSNCILFDADGVYDPSWIPEADMQTLLERNDRAVSYFEDNFTVFGVYHVDGELTLGENYADLGAMECITSLTSTNGEREALFENYAVIWCEKCTDDAIISQLAYDNHSPSVIRVNSILSTLDAFYETYGVTEGDGMYIAPENRISRWY